MWVLDVGPQDRPSTYRLRMGDSEEAPSHPSHLNPTPNTPTPHPPILSIGMNGPGQNPKGPNLIRTLWILAGASSMEVDPLGICTLGIPTRAILHRGTTLMQRGPCQMVCGSGWAPCPLRTGGDWQPRPRPHLDRYREPREVQRPRVCATVGAGLSL